MDISIQFKKDRGKLGILTCASIQAFSVPCLGIADRGAAAQHGNAASDPMKPWGNTPLGAWSSMLRSLEWSEQNEHSYGAPDPVTNLIYVLALQPHFPLERDGILIHGGDLNPTFTSWDGSATHSWLRTHCELEYPKADQFCKTT